MNNHLTNQIRQIFIDYFVRNQHQHLPSSPLVPQNDPSLMFTNSGMVQFKNIFTGHEQVKHNRVVTSQKCIRAGGKHNDLDNVGYTARHHTFFEMLGNFSFGDYFKEQAIYFAFELLTKEFKLPKEKLYATIYHDDDEAYKLWKKISGFSDDKIIRIATNDNFWSMGDLGPCGPCSEIFYDHGPEIPGGLPGSPEEDGDRFVEIWNMVFMQYEQISADTRINLPTKSIDTGMGLERIATILQGKHDNYDIDLFQKLIQSSEKLIAPAMDQKAKFSHRIIADHIRSTMFLIADGVQPSNEGRGYVLRRIMRRAMRHIHQLGAKEPKMHLLVPALIDAMGDFYPELSRAESLAVEAIRGEEEQFKMTLDRGLKILEEAKAKLGKGEVFPGDVAFKLYDTYGFPRDLTEDILKHDDIKLDLDSFEEKMLEQKNLARRNWSGSGDDATNELWIKLYNEFGDSKFVGYQESSIDVVINCLVSSNSHVEKVTLEDPNFIFITKETPCYPESGGQQGDKAVLIGHNNKFKANIIDTRKAYGGLIVHIAQLQEGVVEVGDEAIIEIDEQRRTELRSNHTATHLLHGVLRDVVGEHVTQKGSLVAPDRLRFDISVAKPLTTEQLNLVERKVNELIMANLPVSVKIMDADQAISEGALALFGEKYDKEVRVIAIGENENLSSMELCGGTHVSFTGQIGYFKIISQSALASKVRRIEALTGTYAINYIQLKEQILFSASEKFKCSDIEITKRIEELLNSKKQLEKEYQNLQIKSLGLAKDNIIRNLKNVGNYNYFYQHTQSIDPKAIRTALENIIPQLEDCMVVIINNGDDGKIGIFAAVAQNLSKKLQAGFIAKGLSLFLGGNGGGGKPTLAQAGGQDVNKINFVENELKSILSKF